jgi:small subunit ribosomal protein S13
MARIQGVDLPREKRVETGLQTLYGIGPARARRILDQAGISPDTRVRNLTDEEVRSIDTLIQRDFKIEGDLRRDVSANIKRLMDINCYRGLRHKRSLPVRGQRTHTNARTRKGPRRATVKKKS